VKEGLKLDNLRTDHVMIRSELKYLIGAKIVDLKCRVFDGKTAPFPTVRVFRVVRPVATVRFRVEPNVEPTREYGTVANTSWVGDYREQVMVAQVSYGLCPMCEIPKGGPLGIQLFDHSITQETSIFTRSSWRTIILMLCTFSVSA
jgi:hypothetical protein